MAPLSPRLIFPLLLCLNVLTWSRSRYGQSLGSGAAAGDGLQSSDLASLFKRSYDYSTVSTFGGPEDQVRSQHSLPLRARSTTYDLIVSTAFSRPTGPMCTCCGALCPERYCSWDRVSSKILLHRTICSTTGVYGPPRLASVPLLHPGYQRLRLLHSQPCHIIPAAGSR